MLLSLCLCVIVNCVVLFLSGAKIPLWQQLTAFQCEFWATHTPYILYHSTIHIFFELHDKQLWSFNLELSIVLQHKGQALLHEMYFNMSSCR